MIADLKPYPEYKESGLPWLGRVPSHWEVRQARHVGRMLKGSGGSKVDAVAHGVPCVRYGELYTTHNNFIKRAKSFVTENCALTYTAILYGDVLFAASGEKMEEIGKSAVNLLREPAVCGGDVIILRPFDVSTAAFLGYATNSHGLAYQKATMGRGTTIKHVYPDELRNLTIPLPPPSEQAAIVRFLDWANGRLERAIRAKRKVIALLHEQKQAIIHKAVTQGLDPNVPKRDSGIPWLGEIPSHWEVKRAKYIFREVDQRSDTGAETHLAMSQRLGLVPSSMVQSTLRSDSYAGGKLCEVGDLVLNRLKAHLGVFAMAKQGGVISPDYSVFRKQLKMNMEYFESVLKSTACRSELRVRAKGIVEGFWRLYTDDFYDIRLPVPFIDEQTEIMTAIVSRTHSITTAIDRYEREITLLREYRTRLVADVVTGKLDVREAALSLPEEDVVLTSEDVVNETEEPELEEGGD